jgi:hypothetical protein
MLVFMLTALLVISLSSTGTGSASPLRPDLYQAHLSAPVGSLLPELASSRGVEIYGGVKQIVSGSICLALGIAFGALGIYGLVGAGNATDSSTKTVFTVLGWTGVGFGGVLALVGIPLLIVGIVRVSNRGDQLGLVLDERGQFVVRF